MTQPLPGHRFTELVAVMSRLLGPDGCAWDREQTLTSLRTFLVEESAEVLDAIDSGDLASHQEELGDLLMQVVFQAALRKAEGAFDIDDVSAGIVEKLVRRHPHIFAGTPGIDTSAAVLEQWEQIKAKEKAAKRKVGGVERTLADIPAALPALARAQKLGHRAGKVGFDWPDFDGSLAKVREEVEEVVEAQVLGDAAAAHHEIGDLLFAVVNLARKLSVDAETALRDASGRFTKRFQYIEDALAKEGKRPADSNLGEMDTLWDAAKRVQKT